MTRGFALAFLVLLASASGAADPGLGTLTLDGLSFLSFDDRENLAIPAGSTVTFRFGQPKGDSVPFTIQPGDVSIDPIPLSGGRGELHYALAQPASGVLTRGENGSILRFTATVKATLENGENPGTITHVLEFTTEHAQARSLAASKTVAVDGMRIVPNARYVQLVGAVQNPTRATPQPGAAAYAVLSGTFDWLPDVD
jgi:hypothetical protein